MTARLIIAAATALLAAACSDPEPDAPIADPQTERTLGGGEIVGYSDGATGAQVWLGLPYAAAPQGDLRWRAPQPAEPWTATIEALSHAEPCPQLTNALNAEATGSEPGMLIGSEDCLYVDVYAPPGAEPLEPRAESLEGEPGPLDYGRPVMMWIHGGANIWGYASQYDAARLAAEQDVVVMVVQYRLGPLGFFAHPALSEDTPETLAPDGLGDPAGAANFAVLDLVAALRWARENAAQFGGDADRVTIFGESAGGHNVAALLASPLAEGLFHRAIVQSGSVVSAPLEGARSGSEFAASEAAARFASESAEAAALRAAPLQAIFDAYGNEGLSALPRMVEDGVTIPEGGLFAAIEAGDWNRVPVITGANRDEMKLFNAFSEDLTERWFGTIIRTPDPDLYDAASDYPSRVWRALAVDTPADAMIEQGHAEVWAYRFDWDEAGSVLFMDFSHLLGAAHAIEIPFVFNHFEFFGRLDGALFTDRNADGRSALAGAMGAYWAEFARTGDPGSAGGPDWPAWSETGALMRFDSPAEGGPEVIEDRETIERIAGDLAEDPRLTQDERCAIVASFRDWWEAARETSAQIVGCET
ncbi:MAG: carboxylesterase/lipase family protein [Oceanicaulis sp.]